MSLIESIFYMMWRGIAIGVLISAPMGPVGILCIQRTLEKGRKAGFYTGIGAALSDLFYCLLTGFGLSFIEDFIERNQNIIQLIGSLVLIAFSVYLFKKSPSSSLRRPVPQGVSAKKNILGGFLFTFSNPLILFLIIGLFARFNFMLPEIKFYHYMVGYLFIIAGALGWWYGVTFVIDKIRNRFSFSTMKKINIGIGIVILLFALVGIITGIVGLTSAEASAASVRHWNERRGYAPFADTIGTPSIILYNTATAPAVFSVYTGISHPATDIDFRFTAANMAAHPMKRYAYTSPSGMSDTRRLPEWGIALHSTDGRRLALTFHTLEGEEVYSPTTSIQARATLHYADSLLTTTDFSPADHKIDCGDGDNRYRLSINHGHLLLTGGTGADTPLAEMTLLDFTPDSVGFLLSPAASIRLSDISLYIADAPSYSASADTFPDLIALEDYLTHTRDLTEGYWHSFDHSLDDALLKRGGDYRLAIVKTPGGYDILYLDGATVNADAWRPLMLKGRLEHTPTENIYDLIWYDADGAPLSHGLKAQRDADTNIITLFFPAQNSQMRLHRASTPSAGFNF